MTLAICVIASSFSMFLVDENASKGTHLQKVFGISPWLYHLVNLIYDFVSVLKLLKSHLILDFLFCLYPTNHFHILVCWNNSVHFQFWSIYFLNHCVHFLRVCPNQSLLIQQVLGFAFYLLFTFVKCSLWCPQWRLRLFQLACSYLASHPQQQWCCWRICKRTMRGSRQLIAFVRLYS